MENLIYFIVALLGVVLVVGILHHFAYPKLISAKKSKESNDASCKVESAIYNEIISNMNNFRKAEEEKEYAPIRELIKEIEKNAQLIVNAIISDTLILSKEGKFPSYSAYSDGTLKCEYGYRTIGDQKPELTDSALVKFNEAHEHLVANAIRNHQIYPPRSLIFDSVNEILSRDRLKFKASNTPIEYDVFKVEPICS